MLLTGLLAGVELGLNRVLQMDSTALPRLARLEGKLIEVDCQSPALKLFIHPMPRACNWPATGKAPTACSARPPAACSSRN